MAYRMKRNGAGLASICILATMVLVMISSTGSLYIGAEDSLSERYPHDSGLTLRLSRLEWMDDAHMAEIEAALDGTLEAQKVTPTAREIYRYATISGVFAGEELLTDPTEAGGVTNYNEVYSLYFVPQEDLTACLEPTCNCSRGRRWLVLTIAASNGTPFRLANCSWKLRDRCLGI